MDEVNPIRVNHPLLLKSRSGAEQNSCLSKQTPLVTERHDSFLIFDIKLKTCRNQTQT